MHHEASIIHGIFVQLMNAVLTKILFETNIFLQQNGLYHHINGLFVCMHSCLCISTCAPSRECVYSDVNLLYTRMRIIWPLYDLRPISANTSAIRSQITGTTNWNKKKTHRADRNKIRWAYFRSISSNENITQIIYAIWCNDSLELNWLFIILEPVHSDQELKHSQMQTLAEIKYDGTKRTVHPISPGNWHKFTPQIYTLIKIAELPFNRLLFFWFLSAIRDVCCIFPFVLSLFSGCIYIVFN